MKKLALIFLLAAVFINNPFYTLAQSAPAPENENALVENENLSANQASAVNTVSTMPMDEPPKTGDMLNIIAFLLLAASAVAMIFVLFPKERSF